MPVYVVNPGPKYQKPEDFEDAYKTTNKSFQNKIQNKIQNIIQGYLYDAEAQKTYSCVKTKEQWDIENWKKTIDEYKKYLFYYLTQNEPLPTEKVCKIITKTSGEKEILFNYWPEFHFSTETCKAIIETLKDQRSRRYLFCYHELLSQTLNDHNFKNKLKQEFLKRIFEREQRYYDTYNNRIMEYWDIIFQLDLTEEEQKKIIEHLEDRNLSNLRTMKKKYPDQEKTITKKIVNYINQHSQYQRNNLHTFLEDENTTNLNQDIFSALVNNASYREKWLYLLVHYQKKFKKEIYDLGKVKKVYIDRAIEEDWDSLAQVRNQMKEDPQWKRSRKDIDYLIKTYDKTYKNNSEEFNIPTLPGIFFYDLTNDYTKSFFSKEDQEYFCNELLRQKHPNCYKLYLCHSHKEVHPRMRKHFEKLCEIISDKKIAEFIGACDRNNLFSTKLLSEDFVQRLNNLGLLNNFFETIVRRTSKDKLGKLFSYEAIKNFHPTKPLQEETLKKLQEAGLLNFNFPINKK